MMKIFSCLVAVFLMEIGCLNSFEFIRDSSGYIITSLKNKFFSLPGLKQIKRAVDDIRWVNKMRKTGQLEKTILFLQDPSKFKNYCHASSEFIEELYKNGCVDNQSLDLLNALWTAQVEAHAKAEPSVIYSNVFQEQVREVICDENGNVISEKVHPSVQIHP